MCTVLNGFGGVVSGSARLAERPGDEGYLSVLGNPAGMDVTE